MTLFNAIGLFLAAHFPAVDVIFALSAVLAAGLVLAVPVERKRGDDL